MCRWGEALTQNETQVINSALELTSKTAKTAYTPLEKVFMLPSDAILDEELCGQILTMGHSRVPVHTPGDRRQIIGILLVKELLLVKVRSDLLLDCPGSVRYTLLPGVNHSLRYIRVS